MNFRFPISDFQLNTFGNWKLAIGNYSCLSASIGFIRAAFIAG